jgi:hypothetical protein
MVLIDTTSLEDKVQSLLKANSTIRKYAKRIKTGMYDTSSIKDIEIFIDAGMPIISDTKRMVYGTIYNVPIAINCVCRFRTKSKLSDSLTPLVNQIRDVVEDNYTLGGLCNNYISPFEESADTIDESNPEVFVYTIVINYEIIKTRED